MKQYYECHITMLEDPYHCRSTIENNTTWKFSCIDGDINLGDGIKCYATTQFNIKKPQEEVLQQLNETADFLKMSGIPILRKKIEIIVYDERLKP